MKNLQERFILHHLTSPLEGEVDFQYEQKSASIRKSGEGYHKTCILFTPHPIFQTLKKVFFRVEKAPLPQGARVTCLNALLFEVCQ